MQLSLNMQKKCCHYPETITIRKDKNQKYKKGKKYNCIKVHVSVAIVTCVCHESNDVAVFI